MREREDINILIEIRSVDVPLYNIISNLLILMITDQILQVHIYKTIGRYNLVGLKRKR